MRVFGHTFTMPNVVVFKIKEEAKFWVLDGDKHLGVYMPGE